MDKDKLYKIIDEDDELTDKEKREAYASELENEEWEQREKEEG